MSVNLHKMGFSQGTVLLVASIGTELASLIQQGRADAGARNKPVARDGAMIAILSQDCDLHSQMEGTVELLFLRPAKAKETAQESLQKTRSTKKLVVRYKEVPYYCEVSMISVVLKDEIAKVASSIDGVLAEEQLDILIQWRINRYSRRPLPDVFNQVFIEGYLKDADNPFRKLLENNRGSISDLYAYVYPETEGERLYYASITVLLTKNCSADRKEIIGQEVKLVVQQIHAENDQIHMLQVDWNDHGVNDVPTQDFVAAPEEFSMADAFSMKRLTLDYLCWPDDE